MIAAEIEHGARYHRGPGDNKAVGHHSHPQPCFGVAACHTPRDYTLQTTCIHTPSSPSCTNCLIASLCSLLSPSPFFFFVFVLLCILPQNKPAGLQLFVEPIKAGYVVASRQQKISPYTQQRTTLRNNAQSSSHVIHGQRHLTINPHDSQTSEPCTRVWPVWTCTDLFHVCSPCTRCTFPTSAPIPFRPSAFITCN